MRNRGPDDSGLWADTHARLGQRRLAIVDLSATGHQPMVSADGRYVVTFNGEIYNHAELRKQLEPAGGWRGSSDTETLLESFSAWGIGCLQRFNGMFAFAIWDRHERRLTAARDRMGVKPLYYAAREGNISIASRPSPLTTLLGNDEIDEQALRTYLDLGYIPAPLSLHRDIKKLQPGHYLTMDAKGLRVVRYWDFRHIVPDSSLLQRKESDLTDELESLVLDAVKIRLMADVPFGAFLSGGTDSALVVAAMKAVGVQHPRTFTIGFREPAFDESRAAAQIASHIGVDHTHEILSIGDLLQLLPQYISEFDEPLADNSGFATMAVARLARRHVTVALTGDAGDELFCGYPQYALLQRLAPTTLWSPAFKRRVAALLRVLPWHQGKLLSGALQASTPIALFSYLRGLSKDYTPLLSEDLRARTSGVDQWFEQFATSFAMDLDIPEIGMRLDMGFTLPDDYFQKVDVATMAFSLEARCPLSDYRLVEWAMKLPLHYKLRGSDTKYLLRQVLRRYLPQQCVDRRKQGFSVPVGQWLRGPLRQWATDLLNDRQTMDRVPIHRGRMLKLFDQHVNGIRNAAPLLWTVLMLLCFVARPAAEAALAARKGRQAA